MQIPPHTDGRAPDHGHEHEICVQCFTDNTPGVNFCRKCGAPLSSHAAIGPFEHLFAEGFIYRKAAADPRRLIVVIGMCGIFGATTLSFAILAAGYWRAGHLVWALGAMAVAVLCASIATRTVVSYMKRRNTGPGSANQSAEGTGARRVAEPPIKRS